MIYLLKDTPAHRKLIHRYIDVYEYPDGRIKLRADGVDLAYERYDRLSQVDTAAIVENKRLSHVLQAAQVMQVQRDDRRKSSTPSRTNQGQAPYPRKALPGTKRSRQFTSEDFERAVMSVCSLTHWLLDRPERRGIVQALRALGNCRTDQATFGSGPPPGVPVGSLLARGDVDLGFQQMSELIGIEGIELLGPLSDDVQIQTIF